ncbi:MAG: hypothetical protein PHX21_06050 [bacterium]|nr:hypothetical protein [bacterium]
MINFIPIKTTSSKLKLGKEVTGTYNGVEYSYKYSKDPEDVSSSLIVKIKSSSSYVFRVTRKSKFDDFLKKIGAFSNISTGDVAFDDKLFVYSSNREFARVLLTSSANRRAVTNIFSQGFNTINNDNNTITTIKTTRFIEIATIMEIVSELSNLVKGISAVSSSFPPAGNNRKIQHRMVFVIAILVNFIAIFLAGGGGAEFSPLDTGNAILASFKVSIPSVIILLWLIIMLLKDKLSSYSEYISVYLLYFSATLIAGGGIFICLNGYLDKSTAIPHKVSVVDKYTSSEEHSKSYYAIVESWRDDRSKEKIEVHKYEYKKLVADSSELVIATKPGQFGFEWIVGYEIISP